MPAHIWADIIISDLECQKEACPIAVPVLLADVALCESMIYILHIVCRLDLVVLNIEGNRVLISEEQIHLLLIDSLYLEAIAKDLTERFFTGLLILFRLIPQAVSVFPNEMHGLAGGLAAAICEEN